ncbi:hypothetical protein FS749_008599 [Ceratobasidium sp. UAMH 11750]|nr:hypothetical protein FS749_008599 [Ceratobasidium sp. UAMH 11750]
MHSKKGGESANFALDRELTAAVSVVARRFSSRDTFNTLSSYASAIGLHPPLEHTCLRAIPALGPHMPLNHTPPQSTPALAPHPPSDYTLLPAFTHSASATALTPSTRV